MDDGDGGMVSGVPDERYEREIKWSFFCASRHTFFPETLSYRFRIGFPTHTHSLNTLARVFIQKRKVIFYAFYSVINNTTEEAVE